MDNLDDLELDAWRSFDSGFANDYLRSEKSREQRARKKVVSLISKMYDDLDIDANKEKRALRILEFGSGNGERFDLVLKSGVKVEWTGIDISPALVESATTRYPSQTWLVGNAEYPERVLGNSDERPYDICLFCHVLEMLSSPQLALMKARLMGIYTIIEFFEPPKGVVHRTEIRNLPESNLPYLRHSIGKSTYLTWLVDAGFKKLDIHQTFGEYEVHVLS